MLVLMHCTFDNKSHYNDHWVGFKINATKTELFKYNHSNPLLP